MKKGEEGEEEEEVEKKKSKNDSHGSGTLKRWVRWLVSSCVESRRKFV
jgi:hypothetical protein